ncbi:MULTISPECIES: hypothetical protein [Rhizobium/Agrobacterium group]|uniref:Uncharacterized protein n=2 Tax=Rhizobium/Agrobacterium group TaxID=227290 RepID=B9JUJ2_ALLAM|nr:MULTISPECIES: hypothetical protein [Rhizobium/Agrobacterium group]ACM38115.1 conserved hypothetical protein [Allorhizobium ampelinum S4]MBF2717849.1 hypothetical protein [Agrobacterium vitis]MCF1435973.1 hypothetical protein [Allorhizobium ampelinum]MCF1446909.1 hypothetical protein [Allorhizobium ampelinum]MCF1461601.1 hypothetical protein [Allorhizobium ampelinum]
MKKIVLATAFALTTIIANIVPAQAQSPRMPPPDDDRRGPPHHMQRPPPPPPHCKVRKVVRWHHGEKIVKRVRVCR